MNHVVLVEYRSWNFVKELSIHVDCTPWFAENINKWVERVAVRKEFLEIVNSVGQRNFTFVRKKVREKVENFKSLGSWQPCRECRSVLGFWSKVKRILRMLRRWHGALLFKWKFKRTLATYAPSVRNSNLYMMNIWISDIWNEGWRNKC